MLCVNDFFPTGGLIEPNVHRILVLGLIQHGQVQHMR
jgi:hypothetical protein